MSDEPNAQASETCNHPLVHPREQGVYVEWYCGICKQILSRVEKL
ncbi:MAG: hypothetical protein QN162_14675 [Armatimonadota bacterium]|nr:hypothetical protein [Armatimonadota bacterium]MDR7520736.1 hypothetical protein [Armatimonadota bacterium]MDR7534563.1 hypothetical protein [Armatimonadota bacterium]